jgi:hypothetical protein
LLGGVEEIPAPEFCSRQPADAHDRAAHLLRQALPFLLVGAKEGGPGIWAGNPMFSMGFPEMPPPPTTWGGSREANINDDSPSFLCRDKCAPTRRC